MHEHQTLQFQFHILHKVHKLNQMQWNTQKFFGEVGGGVQQIRLRTEGRKIGDLGAVAP
jgi:hypothetical protein